MLEGRMVAFEGHLLGVFYLGIKKVTWKNSQENVTSAALAP